MDVGPERAREIFVPSAMALAVEQHEMARLGLPSCQNVARVLQWPVNHRAPDLFWSAGGASQRALQLTGRATVIT
jgi:hypothetical protein